MTTITAKVVADSVSPEGIRLTTVHCHYPLVIHAEVLTHRLFSRNARSSRAVPIKTMIQDCLDDPFIPLHWGAARPGMQATEECDNEVGFDAVSAEQAWLQARNYAVAFARDFMTAGYHKQVVNRLLAPFLHIDTLITSTEWENFFELRDHPDAEPHIALLAREIKFAMSTSTPRPILTQGWHLPYIDEATIADMLFTRVVDKLEKSKLDPYIIVARKVSAARAARVSYRAFDGASDIEKDIALADQLLGNGHMSPFEHQATPDIYIDPKALIKQWRHPELSRNFTGWTQYRALIGG